MKRKIKKNLFTVLLILVLLSCSGCVLTITQSKYSPVKVGEPTERMIKRSVEYTDFIKPLTADKFRKMLESDTTHYKIVVITSPYMTNWQALSVIMTSTFAPSFLRRETMSHDLYAAMQPVTPSTMFFP